MQTHGSELLMIVKYIIKYDITIKIFAFKGMEKSYGAIGKMSKMRHYLKYVLKNA